MSNVVRVRVELKPPSLSSKEERENAKEQSFRKMHGIFKKMCVDAGVLHNYKEHESFESKSRKKRRKKRESEISRLKAKLKENFLQGKIYNG